MMAQLQPIPSVREAIAHFDAHLRWEKRMSPYTLRNYASALESFEQWMKENNLEDNWFDLELRDVRNYLIHLQKTLSRKSIHNRFSAIKSFYKYCLGQEWVQKNPCADLMLPKLEKKLPVYLTVDQMKRLLMAPMELMKSGRVAAVTAWQDRSIMELLYGGGFRISEVVQIQWRDIDFERSIVRVVGKGNKERICPVGRLCIHALEQYRAVWVNHSELSAFVFPGKQDVT